MLKNVRVTLLAALLFAFSPQLLYAEGSVDFINYSGKRLFYWANEVQQIKVYAKGGEFLNIGASHLGVNGGFAKIYKPDGTLFGTFDNSGASAGLGIIHNHVEEFNGPTGGGTLGSSGYIPIAIPVGTADEGVWSIIFGFPNVLPSTSGYPFTNLENNEAWDRATHQPDEWAVVSWDATVSTGAAANDGGNTLTGRVFTNQYRTIIAGSGKTTSPMFYMLTRDGIQYMLNFTNIDPYGFDFAANSVGIVDHNRQPTYKSMATDAYTYDDDPSSWTEGNFYIYEPQADDYEGMVNYKIFFNNPATDMPSTATSCNAYTGESYTTWLFQNVTTATLNVSGFNFTALDEYGNPTCVGSNVQAGVGGEISLGTNVAGTIAFSLDINNDGDFSDPIDRVITQNGVAGNNTIFWDGKDGNGDNLNITNGLVLNYLVEMRAGEMHILIRDIENNPGGITFTRINGVNAPDNNFYYDHTEVGGFTSGGTAPAINPTTIPFTYNFYWGNKKMLDYWAYQDVSGSEEGEIVINVVDNCSLPTIQDTDGDGIYDDVDLDDDNDGVPDKKEYCNTLGDFNCFDNNNDPSGDNDGDLVPNYLDANDPEVNNICGDADGDGVCDALAAIYDTDLDGVPDHLDLDSDNDGIPDLIEAGHGEADANMDARIDGPNSDFGVNGLYNDIATDPDAATATITYQILKTSSNIPDHDNLDSDDDGLLDVVEAPALDGDFDGWVGVGTPTVDANGLPYEDEMGDPITLVFSPKDLDGDLAPDYRDVDRDGDGIIDGYECPDQTACIDSDNDGIPDVDELDSDNDGLTDEFECPGGILPCPDSDGDGIDNFREPGCPDIMKPTVAVAAATLCPGATIELSTDNVSGNGTIEYEWFFDDGTSSIALGTTSTPNFSISNTDVTNTGDYAVKVIINDCSSPNSNPVGVTINALDTPEISSSETVFCQGETLALTTDDVAGNNVTYEWFFNNGNTNISLGTTTTPNLDINGVDASDSGEYTVVATVDDCVTPNATPINITINNTNTPTIFTTGNVFCEGETIAFSTDDAGVGVTYEWFFNNGTSNLSLGTTTTPNFTIDTSNSSNSGNYAVIVTTNNCSSPNSDPVDIIVNDNFEPQATNATTQVSPVCEGESVQLSVPIYTGATYEWFGPNNFTSNIPNPVIENI
ncbi:MAG: hypothetical protein AAF573_07215, partial [Bacteroidota bacterium]